MKDMIKMEYLPVKYRDDKDYQGGYFSYCLREVPRGSGVARTYEDIVYLIKEGKNKKSWEKLYFM